MHSVTPQFIDKLRKDVEVWSKVRLIAEWNHNRHAEIQQVTNTSGTLNYAPDLFPIESIVLPVRPKRGIVVAWAVPQGSTPEAYTSDGYEDIRGDARYYTASEESKYKYWTSYNQSNSASPYAIGNVAPAVIYTESVYTNKIRIGFETSVAYPTGYTVYVTTNGTTWNSIGSNFPIASDGTVNLYLQSNGSTWSTTENLGQVTQIRGVRVLVATMSAPSVRLSLIELGARLQMDLSDRVVSYNCKKEVSETSFIAPLGKASRNTAEVELDNTDLLFSNCNSSSMLEGMIDKGVEFRLDLGLNKGTLAVPNYEWVRQFTMYSLEWEGQNREGTNVSLTDSTEYLQNVNPNPALYIEKTLGEVIWTLLDSIGFSSWQYVRDANIPSTIIPSWWTDGQKSVWEAISDLAEVMQAAVFFDEYNILQIRPRETIFAPGQPSVWTMHGQESGDILPDIADVNKEFDFEANVVNISYTPRAISEETPSGIIPMDIVWEAQDTISLRASSLRSVMTPTSMYFTIDSQDAALWPYEGIMQIEGEFIKYKGKQYQYATSGFGIQTKYIYSEDERVALDKTPGVVTNVNNKFSGIIKVESRGYWGSEARDHVPSAPKWLSRFNTPSQTYVWDAGVVSDISAQAVRLRTNATHTVNDHYICSRGSSAEPPYTHYGTRVKFDGTQGLQAAGLAWSLGSNDSGYFAELNLTNSMTATNRALYNEVCFYMRVGGVMKRFGGEGNTKGVPLNVDPGVWYDIDVQHTVSGSNEVVKIFVNGVMQITAVFPAASGPSDALGRRHGLFTRGNSNALFQHLYAYKGGEIVSEDGAMMWNRLYGGYQSAIPRKTLPYAMYDRVLSVTPTDPLNNIANFWMHEFYPRIHEVREFDIRFDESPVLHSQLYFANESQVACPSYRSEPFGANFILVNISRENAIVNGEDSALFGEDSSVTQRMFIYGRNFIESESQIYTVKNDLGVRRRGEVTTEIQSEWIQSKEGADRLGTWIVENWGSGCDQITIESFGNPLLQIGDLVTVNDAESGLNGVQYFVVAKDDRYAEGLETTFRLRRKTT